MVGSPTLALTTGTSLWRNTDNKKPKDKQLPLQATAVIGRNTDNYEEQNSYPCKLHCILVKKIPNKLPL